MDSSIFTCPPINRGGELYDLSDRLLVCGSVSPMRNEAVLGGSDHALYSIDLNNSKTKPITMYSKRFGHTDWVTSVVHTADDRVASSGMDGKICLWDKSRTKCLDLATNKMFPISKLLSSAKENFIISSGYDGTLALWQLSTRNSESNSGPNSTFKLHSQPITDCAFHGNTLVSGDKQGSLIFWDIERSTPLHKFRAYPGAVTAIDCNRSTLGADNQCHTIATGGVDGHIKIWDPRTSSGLVHKIPAHLNVPSHRSDANNYSSNEMKVKQIENKPSAKSVSSTLTIHQKTKNPPPVQDTTNNHSVSVVSCLSSLYSNRGSNSEQSYLVSGSGGAEDCALVLLDARMSYKIIEKWNHAKNGIYSLCVVGESCVLVGDGVGNLLCYDIIKSTVSYGIGSSEKGAVRSILSKVNNSHNTESSNSMKGNMHGSGGKIITVGEDGKALVFDFL